MKRKRRGKRKMGPGTQEPEVVKKATEAVLPKGGKPAAFISEGLHNFMDEATQSRIFTGSGYRDLSTVVVYATRGMIPTRSVQSWMGLMPPMNQPLFRLFIEQMEVADAYNQAVQIILTNEALSKMRFMLTVEEDNLPPPDAHLKLLETMHFLPGQENVPNEEKKKSPYCAVGALYWTKGEGGQPMIYGNSKDPNSGYAPQLPEQNTLQECRGIAMGCTLWDMALFRDKRMQWAEGRWFQTIQNYTPGIGARSGTQDLEFCGRATSLGYRFAVDTRVLVGHLDPGTGIVW